MNYRVQWPRGFNRVAKDLITKLLKPNPGTRISLEEITDHAWFKSQVPIRPVISSYFKPNADGEDAKEDENYRPSKNI